MNRPNGNLEYVIHYMPERGSHGLFIIVRGHDGKTYVAKPVKVEFKEVTYHGTSLGPFLDIDCFEPFTQAVYEEAERKGIKKEGEKLLEGKMLTMENHLNDMRKIVGKQLKVSL